LQQLELEEPVFISPEPTQDNSALITQTLIEQIHQVYQLTLDTKDAQIADLKAELERERRPWFRKLFGSQN
jgi:hypothetical protein